MSAGFIYIAYNELTPDMVKIGRTKNLEKRLVKLNELLPKPFKYIKTYKVKDMIFTEQFILKELAIQRVKNREFIHIDSIEQISYLIDDLILKAHKELDKPKNDRVKQVSSLRIYPSDRRLIEDRYGSIQNALEALLKEIRG